MAGFVNYKVKRPSTFASKLRFTVSRCKLALTTIEYEFSPPPDDDIPIAPGVSTNTVEQEMAMEKLPPPSQETRTSTRVRQSTEEYLQSVTQEDLEFNDFRRKEYNP